MTERCSHINCNKKLKLISFDCKCGGKFCLEHRYTTSHNCPLLQQKKNKNKDNIKQNNPEIQFNKLVKI